MPSARSRLALGRREVLALVGATALGGLAGCSSTTPTTSSETTSSDVTATTTSPEPTTTTTATLLDEDFDFWPGTWTDDDRTVAVYDLLGGRLRLETTTDGDATIAMAMTFHDPVEETTQRRVVHVDGTVRRVSGGSGDDGLVLTGTQVDATGAATPVRERFEASDGDAVAYVRETERDGEWTVDDAADLERTGDAPERPAPSAGPIAGSRSFVTERPPARRFDFWVGEWDVFNDGDSQVGDSVVEFRLDGAVIVENWVGRGGGTGHSFNYYDHAADAWTQTWVAANGSWLEIDGAFADGAMRLEGTQYAPDGSTQDYRGVWTPNPDGTVTQDLYTAADDGDWQLGFSGEYRPAE